MMISGDLVIVLAAVISFAGAAAILFTHRRWRNRRFVGLYEAAGHLKGSVSDGDGLEMPLLRFTVEGRPAMIEYEREEEALTRVRVLMPRRSPGVFRILREKQA